MKAFALVTIVISLMVGYALLFLNGEVTFSFTHTKKSGLIVFTMLLTACISWILSSFLLGSLYFVYQTIRYRKK
ncbi:hypothetical protein [Enterococcus bulliens]